ncbi:MAG: SagB/ThcOx family dehydrogenase [Candidatus Levybacteria bacterium]|nr:SagB/ThcOx family dehydrogenase [Candidatus Levybacteria bacterium]
MAKKNHSKKYKTNYWLKAYGSSENQTGVTVEDLLDKRKFLLQEGIFLYVLNCCFKFRTIPEIIKYIHNQLKLSNEIARTIVSQLIDLNLLVDSKSKSYKVEKKAKLWIKYGWEDALDYFVSIKDYPFLDYGSSEAAYVDNTLMEKYIKNDPVPPIYKKYKGAKQVKLMSNDKSLEKTNIGILLEDKVFDISRGNLDLTKRQISNILFYSFGEMGIVEYPLQGKFLVKTNPSGGARHPTEVYFISLDSEIKKGIYHYSVKNNSLEDMKINFSDEKLREIIFELKTGPNFPVKAVLIVSAIFPRSMWRYRESRSYRVILHDLGHIFENLKIIAKAANVNAYFGHGFKDEELEKLLKIDNSKEAVFKFIAIG